MPTIASLKDRSFKPKEVTAQERAFKHKKIYTRAPLLEVHNLRKEYYSNAGFFKEKDVIHAVNDVSFKLYQGETLGLVGESGCGKSTLLRMICGLEASTSGKIFINSKDVTSLEAAKRGVSMVFQSYALFPHLSVKENRNRG